MAEEAKNLLARAAAIPALMLIGMLAAGASAGCSDSSVESNEIPRGDSKPRVRTVAVAVLDIRPEPYDIRLEFVSRLVASHRADLGFDTAGRVVEISYDEGDTVEKGAVLARLDDSILAAELAQAESNLRLAKRSNERLNKLLTEGVISSDQAERAANELELASARVDLNRARLDDLVLRAPLGGIVARRDVELGEVAVVGKTVFTLMDISRVISEVEVPEYQLLKIREGQKATVSVDAVPGRVFSGTVTQIGIAAKDENQLFEVEVTVENPQARLRPGMVSRVAIAVDRITKALRVPLSASIERSGGRCVFVVEDDFARRIELKDYLIDREFLVVTHNEPRLRRVIVQGQSTLTDGDPVRVLSGERSPVGAEPADPSR